MWGCGDEFTLHKLNVHLRLESPYNISLFYSNHLIIRDMFPLFCAQRSYRESYRSQMCLFDKRQRIGQRIRRVHNDIQYHELLLLVEVHVIDIILFHVPERADS